MISEADSQIPYPEKQTWRKLQRRSVSTFLDWLDAGRRNLDLLRIQQDLTKFIIQRLPTKQDCEEFVSRWPLVLGQCNEPRTFEDWFNVLAYAHVYSLYRYRRFYAVLTELYKIGDLPMKRRPIRVLDIWTGPASCLYALKDFYRQVSLYADAHQEGGLNLEPPITHCVEQSREMARFFHLF